MNFPRLRFFFDFDMILFTILTILSSWLFYPDPPSLPIFILLLIKHNFHSSDSFHNLVISFYSLPNRPICFVVRLIQNSFFLLHIYLESEENLWSVPFGFSSKSGRISQCREQAERSWVAIHWCNDNLIYVFSSSLSPSVHPTHTLSIYILFIYICICICFSISLTCLLQSGISFARFLYCLPLQFFYLLIILWPSFAFNLVTVILWSTPSI